MATAFNTTLLVTGLDKADEFLRIEAGAENGQGLIWHPVTPDKAGHDWQQQFLKSAQPVWPELPGLIGHRAFSHIDPREVNKWFAALPGGIPIRFAERPVDPALFYVGTYFGLRDLSWADKAETYDQRSRSMYSVNGKPAFQLSSAKCRVKFYEVRGSTEPLVVIPTDNQRIQIFAMKSPALTGFELLERIQSLRASAIGAAQETWGGVVLPNVLVEEEIPLGENEILGLNTTSYAGEKVSVFEAGMFLRLVLCPEGPMAEGAAKLGFAKELAMPIGDSRPDYVMDGDFIFAFVDTAVRSTPYVAAWASADEFAQKELSLYDFK